MANKSTNQKKKDSKKTQCTECKKFNSVNGYCRQCGNYPDEYPQCRSWCDKFPID